MNIHIKPVIELWDDGDQYKFQIDFEDGNLPEVEMTEGKSRTLEGAITLINREIFHYIRDAAASN